MSFGTKNQTLALGGAGVFLFAILIFLAQLADKFAPRIFRNDNFAFSLPVPLVLMTVIYALVILAMIIYCAKNYQKFSLSQSFAWLLIFAGAASNLGERLVLGFVRDWIYITAWRWTGIYNLADGYIILGVLFLLFSRGENFKLQIPNIK